MTTPTRRLAGLLVNGAVLGVACLGFAHLWSVRFDASLSQAQQSLEVMVADVDAMAHGALTSMRILRTEAERELRRQSPGRISPQWQALVPQDGGFVTRALPVGLEQRQTSYLFGKGELPEAGSTRAAEMEAALTLVPLMADVRESVAQAAWVYYTSAQHFTSLYPFKSQDMGKSLVWSDDFLSHPLFADAGAERNPERAVRWHEAYLDQAGQGPMTTLVAPVFDGSGQFRAILGLDFTLDALSHYLQETRSTLGPLLIVSRSGQVLAAAASVKGRQLQQLQEVLPEALQASASSLQNQASGECLQLDAWRACALDLREAPWRIMYLVDEHQLGLQTLLDMKVELAGMVLLVLLLVTMERRRRMAAVLKEGDARYRRIIEGSDQGFWDWNIKARQLMASPRFDALLGYGPDESPLRQWDWPNHIHPDDLPRMRASVKRHLKGMLPFHRLEFRALSRTGKWKWLLTQGRVVERDEAGKPVMMSGTLTDITERKRTEAELISAKQTAEAANVAKSRFLAAASHDLRQPLQASNLFVSVLARTPLNEEQARIARNLTLSTKALGELLDALLDISKLDAGVVTPQLAPVEIYEIFQRIESEFASLALEKDLRFKLYFPTRPLIFETDPGLLMGLLRNLIGNAIRYTEWGGVLVGARLRQGCLVIQVWDTGIGIREETLPRIYEEFFQADNPQRDRVRGLGLGLSIVKRMADLLGYQLVCKSRYGRGTLFELSIPLHEYQRPESARTGREDPQQEDYRVLQGSRCVLVEDDPLVASALESWLGSHGIGLQHFTDADAALKDPAIVEADFYVTDFRMPGELNGIEFLNTLQKRGGHPIRALIVTGDTSMEQIDAFASAGWPVLHKPIEPAHLLEVMARLWREIGVR